MSSKSFAKAFFLAVCAIAAAHAEKPPETDARQLLAYIDRKGADPTYRELIAGDKSRWERVLDKVQTGAPLWLEVAQKLAPATDASATIGMQVSLAVALPNNPEGVLRLLGALGQGPLGIDDVCGLPFFDSTEKYDKEHVRRVRAALARVTSPALAAKKAECLTITNKDAARIVPQSARKDY
jgi:hypothetical protein